MIGLIGTHHGTGVTYTGLMLAIYMGEELGKKTAFLECNTHHDFQLLQDAYLWEERGDGAFSFQRITCYKDVSAGQISDILSEDYECFILDFGVNSDCYREELMRCDTKMVIGGKSVWEQRKLGIFMEQMGPVRGSETWLYVIPGMRHKDTAALRKHYGYGVCCVPYENDPTRLNQDTYRFFKGLFP